MPSPAHPNDNAQPVTRVVMDDSAHAGKAYMVTWGETGWPLDAMRDE